jgi:ketosteroid isomerase-like protein
MTLMTGTAPDDVAHRFAAAFSTRDVDRVLKCFTSDATYSDLFYGRFSGRAGLRKLFERMYSEGDHHEWAMTRVVNSPACTIAEWCFTFTVSAAVSRSSGRTLSFHGVSVFETRAGLCHAYREYFDRGTALLALGLSPAAVARITARRPSVEVSAPGPATLRA